MCVSFSFIYYMYSSILIHAHFAYNLGNDSFLVFVHYTHPQQYAGHLHTHVLPRVRPSVRLNVCPSTHPYNDIKVKRGVDIDDMLKVVVVVCVCVCAYRRK